MLRTLIGLAAGVALALCATQALARSHASCLSTAKAAVSSTVVRYPNLASSKSRLKASELSTTICFDFTGDGAKDIAFTVASGGTAGDIAWGILVASASKWKPAIARGGYKLGVLRRARDLIVTQPIYKRNDPNCCPTGGFDHTSYRWNGTRFAVARTWHTKTYAP